MDDKMGSSTPQAGAQGMGVPNVEPMPAQPAVNANMGVGAVPQGAVNPQPAAVNPQPVAGNVPPAAPVAANPVQPAVPINNNPAANQAALGASPNATANGAMPMAPAGAMAGNPMQPGMSQMTSSNQAATPKKKGTSLPIIIIAIVAGLAVLGGVIFLVFNLFQSVDYEEAYNKLDEVNDSIREFAYSDECSTMFRKVSDADVPVEDYNKDAKACVDKLTNIQNVTNEFGQTGAAKKDKDIKEFYEKFKAALDEFAVNPDDKITFYQDYHKTIVDLQDGLSGEEDLTQGFRKVRAALAELKNSKNQALAEYAKVGDEKMVELSQKAQALQDDPSSSNYRELNQMLRDYQEWDTDYANEMVKTEGYTSEAITKMEDACNDLENAVSDAYFESKE